MPLLSDKIKLWKTEDLEPYARNARTHSDEQIEQIAASIKEFGFLNPILVDEKSTIIAGHGRLAAAKLLGLSQVPVIPLTHLTEPQKRAYILADNKLAEIAGWDEDLLKMELADLTEIGFDVELAGFEVDELSDILGGYSEEKKDDEDKPFEFNNTSGGQSSGREVFALRIDFENGLDMQDVFDDLNAKGYKVKRL